jgi:hypothetical protein
MKHKHFIFMFLMMSYTLIIFVLHVYPFINLNGAGGGYDEGGDGDSPGIQSSQYPTIEYYVQAGGSYYLEANSYVQILLKLVEQQEIQGINYTEMQVTVCKALDYMQMANEIYEQLICKAEATPYNETVLAKLRNFDYESFVQKNGFNPILFDLIRHYLQDGDITGMFKRTCSDARGMIDMMNKIREDVSQYRLPEISIFRQLNEMQALTSVFGSYAARVFSEIY